MNLIISLARSRSSVFMRCCIALGLPVRYIQGIKGVNPEGDFESYESNRGVKTNSSEYKPNETLKIMFPAFLFRSEIDPSAKIVLLLRNPAGVVESQGRIGMGQPDPKVRRMNYWRLLTQVSEWIESHPNPVLIVDTDDLMLNPKKWIDLASDFMGAEKLKLEETIALIKQEKSVTPKDEIDDEAQRIYQIMRAKCYTGT